MVLRLPLNTYCSGPRGRECLCCPLERRAPLLLGVPASIRVTYFTTFTLLALGLSAALR
ncbi:MAG: hypothetical protein MUC96_14300 [Myxococcaceae bacterium]|jgi:hypothetical protein|nr:hypothetical protein [Myxococcaceae bacterium]